jgi:hypothetical protein
MKELDKAEQTLSEIEAQITMLRNRLSALILALPDNPKIVRFKGDVSGYVIPSSEIFKQPSLRMDPFYYDFKAQYNLISELVEDRALFIPALRTIIETGTVVHRNKTVYFHPDVVTNLKTIL